MDKPRIEKEAKRLRRQIYERRGEYWTNREPHPFEMLDPAIAAAVLGIRFHCEPYLAIPLPGAKLEIAGFLDRPNKTIAVASRFGPEVTRFTGAHELGHWILHPRERVRHRDLPIEGLARDVREPVEQEADYFAAVFLMPAHFIRKLFKLRFLSDGPFVFNEGTAFYLRPDDPDALLYPEQDSMDRAVTLATARKFNGMHFEKSLHEMLHVSIATMAIRLEELGLVRNYP